MPEAAKAPGMYSHVSRLFTHSTCHPFRSIVLRLHATAPRFSLLQLDPALAEDARQLMIATVSRPPRLGDGRHSHNRKPADHPARRISLTSWPSHRQVP